MVVSVLMEEEGGQQDPVCQQPACETLPAGSASLAHVQKPPLNSPLRSLSLPGLSSSFVVAAQRTVSLVSHWKDCMEL